MVRTRRMPDAVGTLFVGIVHNTILLFIELVSGCLVLPSTTFLCSIAKPFILHTSTSPHLPLIASSVSRFDSLVQSPKCGRPPPSLASRQHWLLLTHYLKISIW